MRGASRFRFSRRPSQASKDRSFSSSSSRVSEAGSTQYWFPDRSFFVIEFKVDAEAFSRDDLNQVWDYALDLKNFHRESHAAAIVPILVATHASRSDVVLSEPYSDGVYPPVTSNRDGLSHLLVEGLRSVKGTPIDAVAWSRSPYQPTPTIIEAARALYSRHSVEDISRHDAGARNLRSRHNGSTS